MDFWTLLATTWTPDSLLDSVKSLDPNEACAASVEVSIPFEHAGRLGAFTIPEASAPHAAMERVLGRMRALHKLFAKKGRHVEFAGQREQSLIAVEQVVQELYRAAHSAGLEPRVTEEDIQYTPMEDHEVLALAQRAKTMDRAAFESWLKRKGKSLKPAQLILIAKEAENTELRDGLVDQGTRRALQGRLCSDAHAAAITGTERHLAQALDRKVHWFESLEIGVPAVLAAGAGHLRVLREIARRADGSDVATHQLGLALEAALRRGRSAAVEFLLDRGVATGGALTFAALAGNLALFERLVELGARMGASTLVVCDPAIVERAFDGALDLARVQQRSSWSSIVSTALRHPKRPRGLGGTESKRRVLKQMLERFPPTVEGMEGVLIALQDQKDGAFARWILRATLDCSPCGPRTPVTTESEWSDGEGGYAEVQLTLMAYALQLCPVWVCEVLQAAGHAPAPGTRVRNDWEDSLAKKRWLETLGPTPRAVPADFFTDALPRSLPTLAKRMVDRDLCGLKLGGTAAEMAEEGFGVEGEGVLLTGRGDPRHHLEVGLEAGRIAWVEFVVSTGSEAWIEQLASAVTARLDALHGPGAGSRERVWAVAGGEIVLVRHTSCSGELSASLGLTLQPPSERVPLAPAFDVATIEALGVATLNDVLPDTFDRAALTVTGAAVVKRGPGVCIELQADSPQSGPISARLDWPESPVDVDGVLSEPLVQALLEALDAAVP